jgi:hypothetical protein
MILAYIILNINSFKCLELIILMGIIGRPRRINISFDYIGEMEIGRRMFVRPEAIFFDCPLISAYLDLRDLAYEVRMQHYRVPVERKGKTDYVVDISEVGFFDWEVLESQEIKEMVYKREAIFLGEIPIARQNLLTQIRDLKEKLNNAVRKEDYERAATLRDQLGDLLKTPK